VFRIKAEYSEQFIVRASIERAREFFGEIHNLVELMPGIESIRREAGGVMRWMVRAEVPTLGTMRQAFTVELTEDRPERIEWSPAPQENKNYLRYAAIFEPKGARATLVRIAQHVEIRRKHAKELHLLAGLIGEGRISAEMQKRVSEMIRTFLERSRARLEGQSLSLAEESRG
jgi:carbon monoxide dehydrogenase subunit G